MKAQITANNLDPNSEGTSANFQIELPDKCPCCSTAYASKPDYACYFCNEFHSTSLYAVFFCPTCEKAFFVIYSINDCDIDEKCGWINSQYPFLSKTSLFSPEISTLSPKFVEIYHQAELAENSELTELCGIGYRKALEFLVKDYAISIHSDSKEIIESSPLGKCINEYIDNPKIKALAKASTWIGNDETHYIRKHDIYNVQDLKRFIKTTVAYIEYELNFSEALGFLHSSQ